MEKHVFETKEELGAAAATLAAGRIRQALQEKGEANIILATGASQFETIKHLVQQDICWSKVNTFHLDEYIGLDASHPASFRKYLQERFVDQVGRLKSFHFIMGDAPNAGEECRRLSKCIMNYPIDVALAGIGENGHLAFNDPPADFETEIPFLVVTLDELCRRQQMGEGWFGTFDEVPQQAISMSIKQILRSKCIILSVPDLRKAKAVHQTLLEDVSPAWPASILQTHPDCSIFLDGPAASLL